MKMVCEDKMVKIVCEDKVIFFFTLFTALHALGHSFDLLSGFIEKRFRFLWFDEGEISFRDAPHNSPRLVLQTWVQTTNKAQNQQRTLLTPTYQVL